jgi:hypothetical protein
MAKELEGARTDKKAAQFCAVAEFLARETA